MAAVKCARRFPERGGPVFSPFAPFPRDRRKDTIFPFEGFPFSSGLQPGQKKRGRNGLLQSRQPLAGFANLSNLVRSECTHLTNMSRLDWLAEWQESRQSKR